MGEAGAYAQLDLEKLELVSHGTGSDYHLSFKNITLFFAIMPLTYLIRLF